MKKIIHIISGLGSGGAENMLLKLLKYSDKDKYYHEVISLKDEGIMGEKIKAEGIKLHSLNLNKKNLFTSLIKARNICKEFDIVDTWLYHADIFGLIISKILLKKKLIWNIRHSNLDKDANTSTVLKIVKLNSILSKYVNRVTYNSNRALENHLRAGYSACKSKIIPNGFELNKFKFDLALRSKVRQDLCIGEKEIVIITVGRWNIQKDYYTLFKALKELRNQNRHFKMIMVGTNLDDSNIELKDLINQYNLKENIILLGRRNDIPALLSSSDIYISSSMGESFSNAIGEAMACELYCVVTDVGDSKIILGNTGITIPPKNPLALTDSLVSYFSYLHSNGLEKNTQARERVIENYDIRAIIKLFELNYDEVIFAD
ncbi:glycosyltransferase [Bacillus fonticola]|uniref:glycosyltransferase n=1 Tax=Bacillus fonticola TaxID=2728853 RepID=UPI001474FB32|nr:glycosyltransferase [Bacillus fonticola]